MNGSKRFIATLLILLTGATTTLLAQRKVPDLDKLAKYDRITEIFLSEHMLKESQLSIGEMGDMPESFNILMRSINSIRIFVAEDPKEIAILKDVFAPIKKCTIKGSELIMSVKKRGNTMNFVGLMDGNYSHGLYLMVDTPSNSTAIIFGGDFTRTQIEQMMRQTSSYHAKGTKNKAHQ